MAIVSRPVSITTFSGQPPRKMPAERMQKPTLLSSFSRARSIAFLYAAPFSKKTRMALCCTIAEQAHHVRAGHPAPAGI